VQGTIVGPTVRRLRQEVIDTDSARPRIALGQHLAAVLLAITVLCMAAARYARPPRSCPAMNLRAGLRKVCPRYRVNELIRPSLVQETLA